MRAFKDSAGREWTVSINIGSIKRVRDLMKLNGESIDLLTPFTGPQPLVNRLFLDLCLLVDVLYCLCRPQAQERKVSDEDFGAAIAGEESKAASEAFFEELISFFQKAGREETAKILAGNLDLVRQEMEAHAQAFGRLQEVAPAMISDEANRQADAVIARFSPPNPCNGETFTSLPPSPAASTPTP
jgi:hypothetical protein